MSNTLLPKNLNKDAALVREGKPDYTKLEAAAFPTPTVAEAGAILENYDTGDRYRWTGTVWIQVAARSKPMVAALNSYHDIILGNVEGASLVSKFSYKSNSTAAGGDEVIWDDGAFVVMTTADTFTITYTAATDGAGGGATGALTLLIDYLDANFDWQTATHVLGATGSDVTAFSGLGINRVVVISSGTADTNVNNITMADTAGTVSTQAIIVAGQGVTKQAIFHIAKNVTPIMDWLWTNVGKIGATHPNVKFKCFVYNRLIDCKFELFDYIIDEQATGSPPDITVPFPLSGRDVVWFTMDTDINATEAAIRFIIVSYNEA